MLMTEQNKSDQKGVLSLEPSKFVNFDINLSDDESNVISQTLVLHHTDASGSALAFKVKTTKPMWYVVRPNQGLIAPGSTRTIELVLSASYKRTLIEHHNSNRNSLSDTTTKDKFLVQSFAVGEEFTDRFPEEFSAGLGKATRTKAGNDFIKALASVWPQGNNAQQPVANSKIFVTHTILGSTQDENKLSFTPDQIYSKDSDSDSTLSIPPTQHHKFSYKNDHQDLAELIKNFESARKNLKDAQISYLKNRSSGNDAEADWDQIAINFYSSLLRKMENDVKQDPSIFNEDKLDERQVQD